MAKLPNSTTGDVRAEAFVSRLTRQGAGRALACGVIATVSIVLAELSHAQLLAVDVDDRETVAAAAEAGNTLTGFNSFTLNGTNTVQTAATTRTIAGYSVTLAPFDDLLDENSATAGVQSTPAGIDDRDRATPINSGDFSNAQIYDDVVFAGGSAGPTGGMDLTVSGGALMASRAYVVSIYAFDSGGSGLRSANWFDATKPLSPALTTSFAGTVLPTSNDQYKFTGIAQTDSTGALVLQGRNTSGYVSAGGVQPGVHINGFEIREFTGLTLEVNTATGTTRFLNEQATSLPMSYYEIRSSAGSLNKDGWVSFDDREGNDPVAAGWDEAGGSSANILSEGNLAGMRTLNAGASAGLGVAFTPGAVADLRFFYSAPGDVSLQVGFVRYVTGADSDADYDNDADIDGQDFLLWQRQLGAAVTNGTGADGNGNGSVDAADLELWRWQFAAGAAALAAAVPEPSSLSLVFLLLPPRLVLRRRRMSAI